MVYNDVKAENSGRPYNSRGCKNWYLVRKPHCEGRLDLLGSRGLVIESHSIEAKFVIVAKDVENSLHKAKDQEVDGVEDGFLVQSCPVTNLKRHPSEILSRCRPQVYLAEQP